MTPPKPSKSTVTLPVSPDEEVLLTDLVDPPPADGVVKIDLGRAAKASTKTTSHVELISGLSPYKPVYYNRCSPWSVLSSLQYRVFRRNGDFSRRPSSCKPALTGAKKLVKDLKL